MQENNFKTKYVLEINDPEDKGCVVAVFDSSMPFMSISVGDFVNTAMFEEANRLGVLKVTRVEHLLWEIKEITTHKICVYTEKQK